MSTPVGRRSRLRCTADEGEVRCIGSACRGSMKSSESSSCSGRGCPLPSWSGLLERVAEVLGGADDLLGDRG